MLPPDKSVAHCQFVNRVSASFVSLTERHARLVATLPRPGRHQRPLVVVTNNDRAWHQSAYLPLLACDNRPVGKTLMALWSVCTEAERVTSFARDLLMPALLLYGEIPTPPATANESAVVARVSRMLPVLSGLAALHERTNSIVSHSLRQLALLYDCSPFSGAVFHVQVVFDCLAKALASLVLLDLVLSAQSSLKSHWSLFVEAMKRNAAETPTIDSKNLAFLAEKLQSAVLTMSLFGRTIRHLDSLRYNAKQQYKMAAVLDEMLASCVNTMKRLDSQKTPDGDEFVSLTCLFIVHAHLTGKYDDKLANAMLALHKRCPGVPLECGGLVWRMDECLKTHVSGYDPRKALEPFDTLCTVWIGKQLPGLVKESASIMTRLSRWCVQLEALCCVVNRSATAEHSSTSTGVTAGKFSALLLEAADTVRPLLTQCRRILELHAVTGTRLSSAVAVVLCRHFEMLKAIEQCVDAVDMRVAAANDMHLVRRRLVQLLKTVRGRLDNRRISPERRVDLVTCLQLASEAVGTAPASHGTLRLVRLALSVCTQHGVLADADTTEATQLLEQLRWLHRPAVFLRSLTRCRFIYWHTAVVVPELRQLRTRPDLAVDRLPLLLSVLNDGAALLSMADAMTKSGALQTVTAYEKQILSYIDQHLLAPVCNDMETALRLDVHIEMNLDQRQRPLLDRIPFVQPLLHSGALGGSLLKLSASAFNVAASIERRLARLFYQLAVVAPHDVSKYEHMRLLAARKYQLGCVSAGLPAVTLDQGVDLLHLARNIDHFVGSHSYDLFNQLFVSSASTNTSGAAERRHTLLSTRHVVNSLRTHGLGVADSVANSVYLYVRRQVALLCRLMADERLQAKLARDAESLLQPNGDGVYSYERAERFRRAALVKWKPSASSCSGGMSVLISLLTRLGVALALARLLDTARRRHVSAALQFSCDQTAAGREYAGVGGASPVLYAVLADRCGDGVSARSRAAASNVDRCWSALCGISAAADLNTNSNNSDGMKRADDTDNSTGGSRRHDDNDDKGRGCDSRGGEYLEMITAALSPALRSHEHRQLRHFYLLLPPLLLCHAESRSVRPTHGDTSNSPSVIMDDAVVLGAVFMLSTLGQLCDFQALNWCDQLQLHYSQQLEKTAAVEAGLQSTNQLTKHRLQLQLNRHVYIGNCLAAASLIFRPN